MGTPLPSGSIFNILAEIHRRSASGLRVITRSISSATQMSKNIKAGFGFPRWRHGKIGGLVGQVKIYFLDARASGAIRVYTLFINAALPDYQVKLNVYVERTPKALQV